MDNRRSYKRKKPLILAITADILVAALILYAFYLTTYVYTPEVEGVPLPAPSGSSVVSGSEETSAPVDTSSGDESTPAKKFADKFTNGEVIKTDNSYKSANVSVTIEKVQENGVTYFVADIYLSDIKYFKTSFGAPDKIGKRDHADEVLRANGGIIAINGDNCLDNPCLLIRNGVYYPKFTHSTADALVMYRDGSMKTIPGSDLDMEAVKAESPYQVWGFGPMLLDNGQPMTSFNTTVAVANPRTAIGYYEPGHYCFVVVDGRQAGYSKGMSMSALSNLFYELGCKEAFNLDGGATSQMAYLGETVNSPTSSYRKTTDVIYIWDE